MSLESSCLEWCKLGWWALKLRSYLQIIDFDQCALSLYHLHEWEILHKLGQQSSDVSKLDGELIRVAADWISMAKKMAPNIPSNDFLEGAFKCSRAPAVKGLGRVATLRCLWEIQKWDEQQVRKWNAGILPSYDCSFGSLSHTHLPYSYGSGTKQIREALQLQQYIVDPH